MIFTAKPAIISFFINISPKAIGREYKNPNHPFPNQSTERFFSCCAICKYAKLSAIFKISFNFKNEMCKIFHKINMIGKMYFCIGLDYQLFEQLQWIAFYEYMFFTIFIVGMPRACRAPF